MASILEVKDLVKNYGKRTVLNGISFSLDKGKVCGFLGPNGAGKTTTMKIIVDLLEKTSGDIKYSDDVKISYLQDVPQFYEFYNIGEYLSFLLSLCNKNYDISKVNDVLKLVGLTKEKDKRIKNLSRGLRQRLGIAAAIINDPDILILDEPVSALDPIGRKEIFDLIMKLRGKMSIIFSSHILSDVEKICDKVIIIDKGTILLDKDINDISFDNNVLNIEFYDDANLKKFIKNYKDKYEINENLVQIVTDNIDDLQMKLFNMFYDKKIKINSINIKKNSLEDIFVREVGSNE